MLSLNRQSSYKPVKCEHLGQIARVERISPELHVNIKTLAIRTTVVPIRILIRTTVVPIRILIHMTGITNTFC